MARQGPTLPSVREQLLHECVAMARYALASGMRVPSTLLAPLEQAPAAAPADVAALAKVHDQLSRLVAPATPRALLLMGDEHGNPRPLPMLGPVGLVRRMMVAAVLSMIVFIGVSLTDAVNNDVTVQSASGLPLLAVEMFWLSAAAMGASFAMLMQVSSYVVRRNYDPKYEPTYWIKFFLGVMAGFILVSLVPINEVSGSTVNLVKPTLALLGGFSASAVHRILVRLVETVESLFRGDAKTEIGRREEVARAKGAEETQQVRVTLAAQVVRMQQEISSGADPRALTARLQEILGSLMPDSALDSSSTTPSAEAPAGTISLPGVNVIGDPPAAEASEPEPAASASDLHPAATASASNDPPATTAG